MRGYRPETYGDGFADVYDEWYRDVSDTEGTVAALTSLAGDGRVLELGVGTGRIALPLASGRPAVTGVDASAAMLDRLAAKDPDRTVTVVLADMASLPFASGGFDVVFAAFNTFFNLVDDRAQAACAAGVHDLLVPGGAFVIEAFVPPAEGLSDSGVSVREVTAERAVITVSRHDDTGRTIHGHHIEFSDRGTRMRPWVLHYRTPVQLDELMNGAGLTLESRWADWQGTRFDETAETHVSVYRRGRL